MEESYGAYIDKAVDVPVVEESSHGTSARLGTPGAVPWHVPFFQAAAKAEPESVRPMAPRRRPCKACIGCKCGSGSRGTAEEQNVEARVWHLERVGGVLTRIWTSTGMPMDAPSGELSTSALDSTRCSGCLETGPPLTLGKFFQHITGVAGVLPRCGNQGASVRKDGKSKTPRRCGNPGDDDSDRNGDPVRPERFLAVDMPGDWCPFVRGTRYSVKILV